MTDVQVRNTILARSIPEPNTGCWLWLGYVGKNGYAADGSNKAHRTSFLAFGGTIPDGMELDHKCRVRSCVNPRHLRAVTHTENMRGRVPPNTRKKSCAKGHAFTLENTYQIGGKSNRRACRRCVLDRARKYNARPKSVVRF